MVRLVLAILVDPEDPEVPKVLEIRWVLVRQGSLVIRIVR